MTYASVNVDKKDGIATVTLSRPDQLNTMNHAFFKDIGDCFTALDEDTSVRAIVLCAEGRLFTAGLDLKEAAETIGNTEGEAARVRERLRRHIIWIQNTFTAIESCRQPVIAAIHNCCIGGGIDLISACDIRLASADAWFGIQEINVAIVADVGTLQRAPYLLPQGILRELAYTGRRFEADEALTHGFINRILPDREATIAAAHDMAREIASKSPLAVAGTKHILNHTRDHTIKDGLEYVAAWNSGQLISEDMMKAGMAALTKQQADFDDLLE